MLVKIENKMEDRILVKVINAYIIVRRRTKSYISFFSLLNWRDFLRKKILYIFKDKVFKEIILNAHI